MELISSLFDFFSLNSEKRQRDKAQHKMEFDRLKRQIENVRTVYPSQKYENDFAKKQDLIQRISRFPQNTK